MNDDRWTVLRRFAEYVVLAGAAVAITSSVMTCVHGRDWRAAHDARHATERRLQNESDQQVLDDYADPHLRERLRAIERAEGGG